ncbi:MAG: N-acetylmuramoyl-L-alanine amidase [Gemmatimonadota bacterium]|nr:N-acetylmuramoyl-L-alanine amidase [Gemmatimonadota bacterium]MDH5195625.1 N-acetylmuramoyl-L-alanine amidase [Gemmatimonadota bacterium]
MSTRHISGVLVAGTVAAAACGTPPAPAPTPAPSGPLVIAVVYPTLVPDSSGELGSAFTSGDSAFVFGSVTRPDAAVTVNGTPVDVAPTGAWLAWIPLPADTVAVIAVHARVAGQRDSLAFRAALPRRFVPPDSGVWIDTASLAPRGDVWIRPGEGVRLAVRATPGATLRVLYPDSSPAVALVPADTGEDRPWGELAFGTAERSGRPAAATRYTGWAVGSLGGDPGPVLGTTGTAPAMDSTFALVEAARDGDTLRVRWPLRVAVLAAADRPVAVVNDDTAGTGETDAILPGRPAPYGTYHWFFPNGTRAVVTGRFNDQVRLQLSQRSVAWVDGPDVQALPPGTPPPGGTTQAMRLRRDSGSVSLRVPLPGRIPFRVDEDGHRLVLTLYGVAANADWMQYGPEDPLVTRIAFEAAAEDETKVVVDLSRPVWGYRTRWVANDLILEIRRPPVVHPRRPLDGIVIAVDPGHPPAGATGPTGTYEGDVVLAVARAAVELFERAGAQVVLLRADTLPFGLVERTRAAEAVNAHLLISIHANALPDGVNPWVNSGTSVYYFHPRAVEFARHVNRALVRRFGFRDLGIGRGDLALARPTWMPAILTEGLFMMVPDQEAVLISPAGQRQYAEGLVDGAAAFLAAWARAR